jgi:hypothetical protein
MINLRKIDGDTTDTEGTSLWPLALPQSRS